MDQRENRKHQQSRYIEKGRLNAKRYRLEKKIEKMERLNLHLRKTHKILDEYFQRIDNPQFQEILISTDDEDCTTTEELK